MARKYHSLLGLTFEGRTLGIALARRGGGGARVVSTRKVALALDPLADEPELVGRELRNQLEAAGLRERRCMLGLPLRWMLTAAAETPALSGEDLGSFLALHAERTFPFAPEDLMLATSTVPLEGGRRLATLVALSRNAATRLHAVCKAAGLRPAGFTLALAALPLPPSAVALVAHEGGLDLAVRAEGGFAALRTLEESLPRDPGAQWNGEGIARQLRITLGALPAPVRAAVRQLVISAPQPHAAALARALEPALARLGLSLGEPTDPAMTLAGAVALAGLGAVPEPFNFMPPRTSRLRQWAGRVSARGALSLGIGLGVLALLVGAAFTWQGMRLARLEREWSALRPRAERTERLQAAVRAVRPWFSDGADSLAIARAITRAFPAEGSVWVKSLEIKDLATVTCNGNARGDREWLALLAALRQAPGIADLQVVQTRGAQPLQFSLTFRWTGEVDDER